jgi:hypothetical protein
MATTKAHDLLCVSIGTTFLISGISLKSPEVGWVTLGAFSGLLISPDWDWSILVSQDNGRIFRVYGRVLSRWKWAGWYYRWLTLYARLIAHRARLSHGLIYPTILRAVWAVWPVIALIIAPLPTLYWLLGLVVADIGHLMLDRRLPNCLRFISKFVLDKS